MKADPGWRAWRPARRATARVAAVLDRMEARDLGVLESNLAKLLDELPASVAPEHADGHAPNVSSAVGRLIPVLLTLPYSAVIILERAIVAAVVDGILWDETGRYGRSVRIIAEDWSLADQLFTPTRKQLNAFADAVRGVKAGIIDGAIERVREVMDEIRRERMDSVLREALGPTEAQSPEASDDPDAARLFTTTFEDEGQGMNPDHVRAFIRALEGVHERTITAFIEMAVELGDIIRAGNVGGEGVAWIARLQEAMDQIKEDDDQADAWKRGGGDPTPA